MRRTAGLRWICWCALLVSFLLFDFAAMATEANLAQVAPHSADAKSTSISAVPQRGRSALDLAPQPASVKLQNGQLTVGAENSDLRQILEAVSHLSGMKVEGLGKSSRVFGVYGPGSPRDVLAGLLSGSGYNFMMIGAQAGGAPRQLLLTERSPEVDVPEPASSATAASEVALPGSSLQEGNGIHGRYQRAVPSEPHATQAGPAPDSAAAQTGTPAVNQPDENQDAQPGPEGLGPGAIYPAPPPQSEDQQERMQQFMQRLQHMHDASTEPEQ